MYRLIAIDIAPYTQLCLFALTSVIFSDIDTSKSNTRREDEMIKKTRTFVILCLGDKVLWVVTR